MKRFGADSVVLLKESKHLAKEKMEEGKVYVQITNVEPYEEDDIDNYNNNNNDDENASLSSRNKYQTTENLEKTEFEKNYGVSKFFYATPFTIDDENGQRKASSATTRDTFLKKTILTTSKKFPYVLRRIPVADRREIVLTPIEKGIESLRKKSDELAQQLAAPDKTMLQLVLQVRSFFRCGQASL